MGDATGTTTASQTDAIGAVWDNEIRPAVALTAEELDAEQRKRFAAGAGKMHWKSTAKVVMWPYYLLGASGLMVITSVILLTYTDNQGYKGIVGWGLLTGGVCALALTLILLPIAIARQRNHPQLEGIKICVLLGCLLPLLWPVALIWAHCDGRAE
jgi:hypothetical protein